MVFHDFIIISLFIMPFFFSFLHLYLHFYILSLLYYLIRSCKTAASYVIRPDFFTYINEKVSWEDF